ncbi:hypothetical protein HYH02_001527 [Chlamydomonas schloesseri]|uniref:Uncharacterized protein n=1 Tax=Chlamydomonas schloesseri TaxID=2026947 RepID=A0A835WV70_9CHLO|nr:hypothetical protein HYH02_001527 [Chlamydomonas schloesseri]|eukprot:KAG2453301.1 hypothetical protein HYH02_001527 [Chlamydomonas schloesseri]
MAKKKQADGASPAKIRRPSGYWAVFNAWWREHFDRTGLRPTVEEMTAWYKANALAVWGPYDAPPLEDLKQLSKGMRSTAHVRDYFKQYRAKKRMAKGGESLVRRVRTGRVAKAGGAKPRRGRRAGSDSSDEEDDPDYGVDFETEEMEDELFEDLAGDEEGVAAGAQQPQPQQQAAAAAAPGSLPHKFGSSTTAQAANPMATAAAFIAAAAAAAAAARAAHAAATGFGGQAGASCGTQPGAEHDQLCYTPRPEEEDATASLAQQASWQHSAQHAAATTALDPVGSGFTQPLAAQSASHAPSPAAATSPPTPSYTGAVGPVSLEHLHLSPTRHGHGSMEGAGCTSEVSGQQSLPPAAMTSTAPTGPAGDGAAAPPLPRHLLGGRFQTTAGSAPLPSHGSVPLPPLPGHVAQEMHVQQQQPASELPGGASRAHSMPCAAYPPAPGPQRHTAPLASLSDPSAVPLPAPWQHYHPQQYPHSHAPYPHHPPPPPHGSAAAPAPYRYGPAGYPPHPAYPHGYHPAAYSAYGYPPYGMPPPPYGYPPAPYGRYSGSASAPPPPYGLPHHSYPHAHGMPPVYPHSAGPPYPHPQQQPVATTTNTAAPPPPHQQLAQGSGAAGSLELSQSLALPRPSDGAGLSWLPSLHDDIDLDAVLEAEMGAAGDSIAFLDLQQHHHHMQQLDKPQAARPSEGGHTDAFAELWVRWDTDKGANGAPAACKEGGSAVAPGSQQQRPCVQVHVFQE